MSDTAPIAGLALRITPSTWETFRLKRDKLVVTAGTDALVVTGDSFDALRDDLAATLLAEVRRFRRAATQTVQPEIDRTGCPPYTMGLKFTVFADETCELILRGRDRKAEHFAKGHKGSLSEWSRLEAFVREACSVYLFEVIYDGDHDRAALADVTEKARGAREAKEQAAESEQVWTHAMKYLETKTAKPKVSIPAPSSKPPEAVLTEAEYQLFDSFRQRLDQMQAELAELKRERDA